MDATKKRQFILTGNMYKVIGTLAFPIMLNNLIQTLYNLADGVWVSKIGSVQFAATSFVWPVNFLFISIGSGLAIAGTSLISQLMGADKKEEAEKYATQLMVLAVLTGIILATVGFILTPFFIKLMGGTGDMAAYGNIYLRITLLDMPFMFCFSIFVAIMNAQGNTVLPTVLSGISAVLNIVLDPLFIFGLNMGVAGAAIATLLSKILLVGAAMYFLTGKHTAIHLRLKKFKFDKEIIKKSIDVALPSSVGQSGAALGFMVLNAFIADYGTATMAAFGMVNRITALVMQPAMGIGAALVAIVGQNLGAKQPERVKEGFRKSFVVTTIIGVLGCMLMLWQDTLIINFFMQSKDDMEVITQGISFLGYIAYSMPLMGIFSVLQGIFQGSGHTKYAMYMEIGRLWFVRLPMILIFKHFTNVGAEGIWFAMSFSNLIICIYGWVLYRRGNWMKRRVAVEEVI